MGSGSLLSGRICVVAQLEAVSAPALSSSLVGRALYVSPDGGPGCSASTGMASFKSKLYSIQYTVNRPELVYHGHTRQQKGNRS